MTAKWWSGNAVGFDTETDGPKPEEARIIQYAVIRVAPGGGKPDTHLNLVKPERDIDPEAVKVHGISTEVAARDGMPRGDGVADICSLLGQANETVPLVAHNAAYDLTVLDREMRRLGLGSLGLDDGLVTIRRDGRTLTRFPVIDTLVLDKAVDQYRPGKGGRQLEKVAVNYGVPMAEGAAHAADADVLASLRIAWKIASMCRWPATRLGERYADRSRSSGLVVSFNGLADMSLIDLHRLQTKWSAEQTASFRRYCETADNGIDPKDVTGGWPFRPYI